MSDEISRDIRIDRVGFVTEVVARYQKPLIERIRQSMAAGERREGDLFDGLLVAGTSTTVDPDDFIRLYDAGKITRAQFARAIKVSTSEARKILDEKTLDRISIQERCTPSLRVTRKHGVQIELVAAIKQLTGEIAGPAHLGEAA